MSSLVTPTHRLHDTWVFYYSPRGKKSTENADNYFKQIKKLGEFSTVEDFFGFYCFLKRPSDVPVDNKILMFRKNCKPLWEDWKDGGCWILQIKKKELEILNKRWEAVLFACIGEQIDNENVIGVVMSKRSKRNLLELWIKNREEDMKVKLGEKLRVFLELDPQNLTFYFKEHSKSLQEKSTLRGIESYTFISTPLETPMMTPLYQGEKAEGKPTEKLEDFNL